MSFPYLNGEFGRVVLFLHVWLIIRIVVTILSVLWK